MRDALLISKVYTGIRNGWKQKEIAAKAGCTTCTVNHLARVRPTRVLLFGDTHCGSEVGLTPPVYQWQCVGDPTNEEHRKRNKFARLQKECYTWYTNTLDLLRPIDRVFHMGDLTDGDGKRSGGTEQITTDRKVQVGMAIEAIEQIRCDKHIFVYGTPYHTGDAEDFEVDIAKHFNAKIGSHEWEKINGVVFDLKHKQGATQNPATSLFTAIRDNREWAVLDEQPKADVLVRASIPSLQAYGCLTAGHKILTSDLRYVPVETLGMGDKLLAFEAEATKGKKRRWVESEVVANHPVKAEVYKITLSDGTILEATKDHPFLSQYRGNQYIWKTVEELYKQFKKAGSHIRFRRTLPVWSTDTSYEAGYLAGFYDSEGCLCQTEVKPQGRRFVVSACQNKLAAKQKENPCYRTAVDYTAKLGYTISNRSKSDARENIHTFDVLGGITEVLRFLGSVRPKRLLEKLDISKLGQLRSTTKIDLYIIDIKLVGIKTVFALGTTSETYISEGFLSHNTKFGARQCSRKVQFGLMALDVWPDGVVIPHVHIAKLAGHKTRVN